MNEQQILARLRSIEKEVEELKAELDQKAGKRKQRRFADLYGIWKGKSSFTYEEIKDAEIKLKDELDDSGS